MRNNPPGLKDKPPGNASTAYYLAERIVILAGISFVQLRWFSVVGHANEMKKEFSEVRVQRAKSKKFPQL